jgi:hypothetical protein
VFVGVIVIVGVVVGLPTGSGVKVGSGIGVGVDVGVLGGSGVDVGTIDGEAVWEAGTGVGDSIVTSVQIDRNIAIIRMTIVTNANPARNIGR